MLSYYSIRLLKRGLREPCHSFILPCAKRRKLSSGSTSSSMGAARSLRPPYFSPNSIVESLSLEPSLKVTYPNNVSFASQKEFGDYKVQSITSLSQLLKIYGQLSKSRLTFLILLTSMTGVAISPLPTTVPVLLSTALGTALCSASANTFNQIREVPFDAQMSRTRTRPLVRGAISSGHATVFGIVAGLAGPAILATFVNPTAALLGAANIFLYAGVYTSLKRTSILNTWVGSVVGGIPPLIGWTACGGKLFPSSSYPVEFFPPSFFPEASHIIPLLHVDNPLSPLALFCLLFSWQFPHFNSLAHLTRDSYARSGYKMLSVTNPKLNSLVSLRHSIALLGICSILTPLSGLTTWAFALSSLIPNAFLTRAAWNFWRSGIEKDARKLWNISLWYLPVVLALMMFHKQGMEWLSFLGWKGHDEIKIEQKDSVI